MTVAIFPARDSHALGIHDLFVTVAAEQIHLLRVDAPGIEEVHEAIERCMWRRRGLPGCLRWGQGGWEYWCFAHETLGMPPRGGTVDDGASRVQG